MNQDAVSKSTRKLRKLVKKSPRRPNVEYVHDLRTRSRKFESLLVALEPEFSKRERRLLRRVKRVHSRAGKVRDMDVLTDNAAGLRHREIQGADERACLVSLLEHLGARRMRSARKLRRVLKKSGPELRRDLKRSEKKLSRRIADRDAAAEAVARVLELSAALRNPAHLNRGNLHQYRLKVKELRYVLRLAENADHSRFAAKLGEVKDKIGEWHDWEELSAIANKITSHDGCRLMPHLRTITRQKFEAALSSATQLRKEFLLPQDSKAEGAQSIPVRLPVLEAVAGFAA